MTKRIIVAAVFLLVSFFLAFFALSWLVGFRLLQYTRIYEIIMMYHFRHGCARV